MSSSRCPGPWRRVEGATPTAYLDRLRHALLHHAEGRLADDAAMLLVERSAEVERGGAPPPEGCRRYETGAPNSPIAPATIASRRAWWAPRQ